MAGISSLTKPESIYAITRLSAQDEEKLAFLEKSVADLQSKDTEQQAKQLSLRAERIRALAKELNSHESTLSDIKFDAAIEAKKSLTDKTEAAQSLRDAVFNSGVLKGTGSETWRALWEAARRFSHQHAYPERGYPFTDAGAQCVLCQQDVGPEAAKALKSFEDFVVSPAERELKQASESYQEHRSRFSGLLATGFASEGNAKEVRIEQEAIADQVDSAIANNRTRCETFLKSLDEGAPFQGPPLTSTSAALTALAEQLDQRVTALRAVNSVESRAKYLAELQELRARKLLFKFEKRILDEVDRKGKYAAYALCIEDTKTNAITQKSTAVTRVRVSQALKDGFTKEVENLGFRHVEVELREAGGADGVLYHKLVLKRAPGVELPKVVSEGEQRCLSIAAFFAELCTADDPSAIVFDDPVSSLDFRWREGVARRLVVEAQKRQVIVFTHDVVFLLLLSEFAKSSGVALEEQFVRRLMIGAGVCTPDLPWIALPIKKKIGYLKNELQAAEKLFRDGHQAAYEKDAKYLYGLLREAWERAIEESLLAGIVERFRPSIKTMHIATIADISKEDCAAIEGGMTKTSKWLPGHDQAAAARAPVPEPPELKADIEALESWVTSIIKRRK